VALDGRVVGQQVADITLRDIAAMLGRFELPARIEMERVAVGVEGPSAREDVPFVFEAKPYRYRRDYTFA